MKTQKKRIAAGILFLALLVGLAVFVNADIDRSYTQEDAELLAKTVWGEARGCTITEQAAVVWCILNRVDAQPFPNTIRRVVTQPYQFLGYTESNPVDPDILSLCQDVLARWVAEPNCIGDIGRVLPPEYCFFSGWGGHNWFRQKYYSGPVWDWSLPSPY